MSVVHEVERFLRDPARTVVPKRTDYPDGHAIAPHRHRRHQLLHGTSGVVVVATPQGAWVMPPGRGLWIPAGVVHDVRILGAVQMHSLYFEPRAVEGMPARCQVVGMPPFMRSLVAEAVRLPMTYVRDTRVDALMALIRQEVRRLPHLPLSLPFPDHERLAQKCRAFLRQPDLHETIDDWSDALGMSRRSFTRLFRRETGVSFMNWRQQACLVSALPRLAAGDTVTTVAFDLGYENPAAFTVMFKRALGASPRHYFREQR